MALEPLFIVFRCIYAQVNQRAKTHAELPKPKLSKARPDAPKSTGKNAPKTNAIKKVWHRAKSVVNSGQT